MPPKGCRPKITNKNMGAEPASRTWGAALTQGLPQILIRGWLLLPAWQHSGSGALQGNWPQWKKRPRQEPKKPAYEATAGQAELAVPGSPFSRCHQPAAARLFIAEMPPHWQLRLHKAQEQKVPWFPKEAKQKAPDFATPTHSAAAAAASVSCT